MSEIKVDQMNGQMSLCDKGADAAGKERPDAPTPSDGAGLAMRLVAEAGLDMELGNCTYEELKEEAFEEWLLEKREAGAVHV